MRPGRPRNTNIDDAVLTETLSALDAHGYRFSLEEVARRAGTSKPAVYRRWPTRQNLVLAALSRRLGSVEPPDTSCSMCDLSESLSLFVDAFRRMPPGVLTPLLADCADDEYLHATFMATLFDPPRAAVRRTLSRAHARGDLRSDLDLDLVVDLLGAFVYYRALFGHAPISPEEIEATVDTTLQGIATDYPRLLREVRLHDSAVESHLLHAD